MTATMVRPVDELAAEFAERDDLYELLQVAEDRYFPEHRSTQAAPGGDWRVWLILAGRGFGKTRTGAEWIVDQALAEAGDYAVAAPTFSDARDVCVEGPSGILAVLRRRWREPALWNRSHGEMRLQNGSRIKLLSADEPDRARGWNFRGAWCDELAAWRHPDAWVQLQLALRIGDSPRTVVTTTPRPVPLVTELIGREASDGVTVARGTTFENRENLSSAAIADLERQYGGTRLGRQELYGELLEDVPGAMWTPALIDEARVDDFPPLVELAIGVDPAVTAGTDSDETGIVAVGVDEEGHCWVIEDLSVIASPETVVRTLVNAYHVLEADRLVVERNNGGDWIPALIGTADRSVAVETVWAKRGKALRAQPVASLYERGEVHHVGYHADLEAQMCNWVPGADSPDRLDALVWAITDLRLRHDQRRRPGGVVMTGVA